MKRILGLALPLVVLLIAGTVHGLKPHDVAQDNTGGTWSGDIDLNDNDITNGTLLTGDVAPVGASVGVGGNASPYATTAASLIGAPTIVAGGLGTTNTKIIDYTVCGGKWVTVSGVSSKGVAWTETYTEGAAAPLGWAAATSNAVTATNLAATVDAGAIASLYLDAAAGGAGGVFVGLQVKPGTTQGGLTIATNQATCDTVLNGADGGLLITAGLSTTVPVIGSTFYPNNGFSIHSLGLPGLMYGGSLKWYCDSTLCYAGAASSVYLPNDLLLGDDINPAVSAVATDAASVVQVYQAQLPFQSPVSVASTYRDGGSIVLSPGQGKQVVGEIVPATVAGKTITLTATLQGVLQAGVTKTEGVASPNGFACATLTSAQCATNMLTLLNGAGAVSGCTTACIDGTCSNGQISIYPTVGVGERCVFTTNDAVAFPLTAADQGVDGRMQMAIREADLAAGACYPGSWIIDTGGATREMCHCNISGAAYDCISLTTANGPTD